MSKAFWDYAPRPPMGWNSWDCFATTVREEQVLSQADVMAKELKSFGWDTVVVDIQWYEPGAESYSYRAGVELAHDEFGRLQPAENRFPSAKGGVGFKPLADRIHEQGLKFGVHLMRGIPRICVEKNTAIFGTEFRAKDIANKADTCPWNPDMYGVDMSKPGAQDYYNSVFKMLADWGVDYVKVDDISRPYTDRKPEIEAIRKAIDNCGRSMVLSLSPGETDLAEAAHAVDHANLWRISDDFWDDWQLLKDQFARCAAWAEFSGPGHWPDADMLPIGHLRFGEPTKFTRAEQRTMMNLWAICRSPLMMGGDLTKLDDWTKGLLKNEKLIDVNQRGYRAKQVFRDDEIAVWRSESERGDAVYIGVFNLTDSNWKGGVDLSGVGLAPGAKGDDVWGDGIVEYGDSGRIETTLESHSSQLFVFRNLGKRAKVSEFEIGQVRLLDSAFKTAQLVNGEYLLMLEADRLLANFRTSAGLKPKAEAYPGWEQMGIAGHSLGHYLSGLAWHFGATGSKEHLDRLHGVVGELKECQDARSDGYIGGIPDADKVWDEIRAGEIRSQGFDLNGLWVPWYTIHKTFAGLLDAYLVGGVIDSLPIAERLGEWVYKLTQKVTDAQWQTMLACEHGGMNESMIELYRLTGNEHFKALYGKFDHKAVLDPLRVGRDDLQGKHSNTQIPKIIGLAKGYEVLGDLEGRRAAEFFWGRIAQGRTYANGGNSNHEHLGRYGILADELSMNTSETCNSYNMLKLTAHLNSWNMSSGYGDYAEKVLWNHILGSQNGKPGGFTYFVPLKGRSARPFSEPFEHFWCCVGTGMENHARYGISVFLQRDDELIIDQFISARLDWMEEGITVELTSDLPGTGKMGLHFAHAERKSLSVAIRKPHWCKSEVEFKVNGISVAAGVREDGYWVINRMWMSDDRLTWELPLPLRVETMPDDSRRFAIFKGPILLAAESEGLNIDPVAIADSWDDVVSKLKETGGAHYFYETVDLIKPRDLVLKPFYLFTEGSYTTYFDRRTESEWLTLERLAAEEALAQAELERRTVDTIRIGEMQPERDHNLTGVLSETGVHMDRNWRHARPGGFFEFTMKCDPLVACEAVLTFWLGDRGRNWRILANGKELHVGGFPPGASLGFADLRFDLPTSVDQVLIRFEPIGDSMTAGLYGCRVVRKG